MVLYRVLAHPYWPAIVVAIAMVLTLPALWIGIGVDDEVQRQILLGHQPFGETGATPVTELFAFYPDTPVAKTTLQARGALPWWSDPDLRVAFLRPLSAFTHVIDYALWPDNFALQHAHSLLWYALAVLMVFLFYQHIIIGASEGSRSPAVAGLAALMFAVEDAHAIPVAWLANRNSLLAVTFGVVAVICHVRWRREDNKGWLVAALVALVAALLSAEAGVGAVAFIVAYQVALDRASVWSRLMALVPALATVAVWRIVYTVAGYGARGSELYVSPTQQPGAFLAAILENVPLLLTSQWFQVPPDHLILAPKGIYVACVVISLVLLVFLGWFFKRLLQDSAHARFFAVGMVLSMVPFAATIPMDRLLVFAGIGAFGLLACQVERLGWLNPGQGGIAPAAQPGRYVRRITVGLVVLHLGLGWIMLPARIAVLPIVFQTMRMGTGVIPSAPEMADETWVWVTGSDFACYHLPYWRLRDGKVPPRRVVLLAINLRAVEVTTLSNRSLRMRPDGGFLGSRSERATRSLERPFTLGETITAEDFTATIDEVTSDGRPAQVTFTFAQPLKHNTLRWLYSHEGEMKPFPLPAVGKTVRIEPSFPVLP